MLRTITILGNCMENEGVVPLNNAIFDSKKINHGIDIYFFPASPPARATLMLLKALGIKHTVHDVNIPAGEHLSPEFIKMNPLHTVPTIDDNGFILWDSHVIMIYLVSQYAKEDSLYPKDPKKAALVNQILYFQAGTLFPRLSAYTVPVFFGDQQPDPEVARKLEESLQFLDDYLSQRDFLGGNTLTVADFSIVTVVSSLEALSFDISKYVNLYAWYEKMKSSMAHYGFQDINQKGADLLGELFKSKLKF